MLLRAAQGALRGGDGRAALAHLDEHARRFPAGALTAERRAARVLALCASGRAAEAGADAARFEEEYPRSPLLSRVSAACDF